MAKEWDKDAEGRPIGTGREFPDGTDPAGDREGATVTHDRPPRPRPVQGAAQGREPGAHG